MGTISGGDKPQKHLLRLFTIKSCVENSLMLVHFPFADERIEWSSLLSHRGGVCRNGQFSLTNTSPAGSAQPLQAHCCSLLRLFAVMTMWNCGDSVLQL